MWRWAFLPPEHADKEQIYSKLWQSMVQWIISQQDMMPGQKVAVRSDRANFLSGERASLSITVKDPAQFTDSSGRFELDVLLEAVDADLPKRFALSASGMEEGLFRADLGTLPVGYYTARVVRGDKDESVATTAFEVRDPWFESLEVDARPDLMRQVAKLSGGAVLSADDIPKLATDFEQRLKEQQRVEEIKTTLWDRPLVLLLILAGWTITWVVRRQSGLV